MASERRVAWRRDLWLVKAGGVDGERVSRSRERLLRWSNARYSCRITGVIFW
jgi:hypothetical protein